MISILIGALLIITISLLIKRNNLNHTELKVDFDMEPYEKELLLAIENQNGKDAEQIYEMYVEGNKGKEDRVTQLLQGQIIEIENKYNSKEITSNEAVEQLSILVSYISDASATDMITEIQNHAYTDLYGPKVIGTWKADDVKNVRRDPAYARTVILTINDDMSYHLEERIPAEKGVLLETPKINAHDGTWTITNDYGISGHYTLKLQGLGSYQFKEHATQFDITLEDIVYELQKQ